MQFLLFFKDKPNAEPNPNENALIIMMVLVVGGLGLAWKWELIGAMISLAGFIGVGILNPDAMTMPMFFLFPLTALLFLICWRRSKLQLKKEENSGLGE